MRIHKTSQFSTNPNPLQQDEVAVPTPAPDEVLVRVIACGVCHTELDEIEGRTPPVSFPMTPGHQVTGEIMAAGSDCTASLEGRLVGVGWIWSVCGTCMYCSSGQENLCTSFTACGRDVDGGYAQYMVVPAAFACPLPESLDPLQAAPLLCAGSVGYRALDQCRLKNGQTLGLTGFGASGHLVLKMARHIYPESRILVYSRNAEEQAFARELGAYWAGHTEDSAPCRPSAIIDTTPAWKPMRCALSELAPGGKLIVNAIRKEENDKRELLDLSYERHMWREKTIQSVANVTRRDVRHCLRLAAEFGLLPEITTYPLAEANRALAELKQGGLRGAKVLRVS